MTDTIYRPDPKPERKPKKKYAGIKRTPLKKKFPKKTGEKELFLEIWNERPHVSAVNGEPLGDEPHVYMFMHVLGKKAFPKYRLEKKNILLASFDQHYYYDNGGTPHPDDAKGWQRIFELKEELKIQYHKPQPTI